jgi:hypothetical protein
MTFNELLSATVYFKVLGVDKDRAGYIYFTISCDLGMTLEKYNVKVINL